MANMSDEVTNKLFGMIRELQSQINNLNTNTSVTWITKTTAGTPATVLSGVFVENTNDNTLHVGADTGWRQLWP